MSAHCHYDMMRFLTGGNAKTVCKCVEPKVDVTKGPQVLLCHHRFENGVRACFSNHMSSVGAETEFQGNL